MLAGSRTDSGGRGADLNNFFNPASWGRALTKPLVLLGLAVDLFPIYGVIAFGWNAVPLVMLYWMENIIAGAFTIPRIFVSGASFGGAGFLLGAFLCVFFVFHYGLFCAVHGTFLMVFIAMGDSSLANQPPVMMDVGAMFRFGLTSAPNVEYFVCAIIGFQALVLLWEFFVKGEWKTTNPMAEMFAPYGRIIVLHFAIFAGAGALFLLGQPVIGVVGLILFRAVYGVISNSGGAFGFENEFTKSLEAARNREAFMKAMRGEKVDEPEA